MSLFGATAESAPSVRHCHHCRGVFRHVNRFGRIAPLNPFNEEPPPFFLEPPGFDPQGEPPYVPEPSPAPGPAPYPQGFALDVPVKAGDRDHEEGGKPTQPLDRYRQVADALAYCWDPPPRFDDRPWREVTLRVSFKRDGTVNGLPRIPYVDQGLTETARSGLTRSLMGALQRCTPLPFSAGLGGAIAGQVFALRFIEQDQDTWPTPRQP